MSKATLISTPMINLTVTTSPYQDLDGKDNNLQDLESDEKLVLNNFDSVQITFDPINHGAFLNPHVSEQSFGLLGIGGLLLLLFLLAFISFLRQRNLTQVDFVIIPKQVLQFFISEIFWWKSAKPKSVLSDTAVQCLHDYCDDRTLTTCYQHRTTWLWWCS